MKKFNVMKNTNTMDEHHLSLTSPGPSGAQHFDQSINISFELPHQNLLVGSQVNMDFPQESHATGKDPMNRFWNEGNDAPWVPRNLTSGSGDGNTHYLVSSIQTSQLMAPTRSNVVPSEIMPQSDSGYGSYHNHTSIPNGSVCEDPFDVNPDNQSIMGRSMIDARFRLSDHMSSSDTIGLGGPCGSWDSPISPSITIETVDNRCPVCAKSVRTKSEMKKHDQRHRKPFKCDVDECARRIEGFSTPNDLDRHKRSVHPDAPTLGNRYVCQIGNCKSKAKIWPRADNFKAHLRRVHQRDNISEEELETYIVKQPTQPTQAMSDPSHGPRQETLSGFHGFPGLPNGQTNWSSFAEVSQPMEQLGPVGEIENEENFSFKSSQHQLADLHIHHSAAQQEVYQGLTGVHQPGHRSMDMSSPTQHSELTLDSNTPASVPSSVRGQVTPSIREQSVESQLIGFDASKLSLFDGPDESMLDASPILSPLEDTVKRVGGVCDAIELEPHTAHRVGPPTLDLSTLNLDNTNEIEKLVGLLANRGFLERLGWKKECPEAVASLKPEPEVATNQNQPHRCQTCNKAFPRRCELKKHEKRHEKPYGCTAPDCDKRFGSKNDWKRHENTQHSNMEVWRCDEGACTRICYRRDVLKIHLDKDHHVTDPNVLEARVEKCRLGHNREDRFWCGFCQEIVEITQGWAERFDHIDEHFTGRNGAQKEISEWKEFDPSCQGKQTPKEDSVFESAQQTIRQTVQRSLSQVRPKRKRNDGDSGNKSKKAKVLESRGMLCCLCGDLLMESSPRCCNFPCEHIPCSDCKRGH
ncbi:hypothetical protein F4808DRAFT_192479 [Astrocystis sublimbata]|nr:hypothetical protein F4808DRAFT_192479 [Astrocystis sublimbata]